MDRVALLGLGAMGSRMAVKLIEAGFEVTVWNRTRARAEALVGARIAPTPRAAAAEAALVISMVRGDEASKAVWLDPQGGALQGLAPDALAIECSTLSVPWVRTLASTFGDAGRMFVDAPLAGSRPQADAGKLIFFVGGGEEEFDRVKPVLTPMAAAVHHVGDAGAGATLKLMVNSLLAAQVGLIGELIGFAAASGIEPEHAVEIIGSTPVCSAAAKVSAQAMVAGAWAPAFPVDLVAKDLRLLARSAGQVNADVPVSTCVGEVYEQGIRQGIGEDNITGIVQLYR